MRQTERDERWCNRLFFIAGSSMGVACTVAAPPSTDDGSGTTSSSAEASSTAMAATDGGDPPSDATSGGLDAPADTGGSGESGATTGDGSSTGWAEASETDASSTADDHDQSTATTDGGSAPSEVCATYAAHVVDCGFVATYDQFVESCLEVFGGYVEASAVCLATIEDYYVCVASTDCRVLLEGAPGKACEAIGVTIPDVCSP